MTEAEYRAACKTWGETQYRPGWAQGDPWPQPISTQRPNEPDYHFGGRWADFAENVYTPYRDGHMEFDDPQYSGGGGAKSPPPRPPKRD